MNIVALLILAVLIAINALFVAAEFAIVAAKRARLAVAASQGSTLSAAVLKVAENRAAMDRYVATCQIGITLSSLLAGALAQAFFAAPLADWLAVTWSLSATSSLSTAVIVILLVLTASQVVLGELLPKSIALRYPERSALLSFLPTAWSSTALRPLIALLNGSGLAILRLLRIHPKEEHHVHSPEELALVFREARSAGSIDERSHRRLQRALSLPKLSVRQVMVPRQQIDAIQVDTSPEQVYALIGKSPHSRLPVYDKSLDDIIGSVCVKELAVRLATGAKLERLRDVLQPIAFVPEHLSAERLVAWMKAERTAKAVVVDEFGGVVGMVSLNDVLGALIGGLDEDDDDALQPRAVEDGWLQVPGALSLSDTEQWLCIPWEGRSATVGGHIIASIERLPREGERFELHGCEIVIEAMSRTAIRSLLIRPLQPNTLAGSEEAT
ncbi:MAG: hemolysin family protein [Myxococcota bacterium]|nr:hemolysin family protein [Myxococcota bacterium]